MVGITDLPTLDPALASDPASLTVVSLVYGGLVRLDAHMRVVPDGSDRWTITHAGTVYRFHVRRNLRFPDGRRVKASDFASAIRRAMVATGQNGTASLYLGLIAQGMARVPGLARPAPGVQALGPSTLQIVLVHPAAHFLAQLAFPTSYVPDPREMAKFGAAWTDHATGFGPYIVRSWRHGREITLERNRYYYAGTPRVRTITIKFYQQPDGAASAFTRKQLDIASGFPPGAMVDAGSADIQRVSALALDYLAFNTNRLPFKRLYARRAFAAIWSVRIAQETVGQAAFAARGLLPPSLGVPTDTFRPIGSASAYLTRARYPSGRNFPALTLVFPRDPEVYKVARRLQQAWSAVLGISVAIRQLDPSTYNEVLDQHDFDLAIVRWGGDYPDPEDFFGTQLGATAGNVTGWGGKAYTRSVNLADSYAPTDPRRSTLFRLASRIVRDKVPIVPLDEPALVALVSPRLVGVHLTSLGTVEGSWNSVGFRQ